MLIGAEGEAPEAQFADKPYHLEYSGSGIEKNTKEWCTNGINNIQFRKHEA
jgi:hypothetical protein